MLGNEVQGKRQPQQTCRDVIVCNSERDVGVGSAISVIVISDNAR